MYVDNTVVRRVSGDKMRFKAQCRALDRLGIRYRLADNGEPLVRPEDLDPKMKTATRKEPRWDRLENSNAKRRIPAAAT
jgi:hypothetical protein